MSCERTPTKSNNQYEAHSVLASGSIHRKDVDMLDELIMRSGFMAGNRITFTVNDGGSWLVRSADRHQVAVIVAKWTAE